MFKPASTMTPKSLICAVIERAAGGDVAAIQWLKEQGLLFYDHNQGIFRCEWTEQARHYVSDLP